MCFGIRWFAFRGPFHTEMVDRALLSRGSRPWVSAFDRPHRSGRWRSHRLPSGLKRSRRGRGHWGRATRKGGRPTGGRRLAGGRRFDQGARRTRVRGCGKRGRDGRRGRTGARNEGRNELRSGRRRGGGAARGRPATFSAMAPDPRADTDGRNGYDHNRRGGAEPTPQRR